MEVLAVDGDRARCGARGVEREVSLLLLLDEPIVVGDFVMVHIDRAVHKMTAQQARSTWELYDELLAAEQSNERNERKRGAYLEDPRLT